MALNTKFMQRLIIKNDSKKHYGYNIVVRELTIFSNRIPLCPITFAQLENDTVKTSCKDSSMITKL